MKFFSTLSILFVLCACSDKPVFVQNGFFCNGVKESQPTTDIQLYKKYAIISVDGKNIKLGKKNIYKNYIAYSNDYYRLDFYFDISSFEGIASGEDENQVRIGFTLNNRRCFWAETEIENPHQHLQSKEIDEEVQRKLNKLFE